MEEIAVDKPGEEAEQILNTYNTWIQEAIGKNSWIQEAIGKNYNSWIQEALGKNYITPGYRRL